MADTDRDQRARPASAKDCPEARCGGCTYCVTGNCKRAARRKSRREGKREAQGNG